MRLLYAFPEPLPLPRARGVQVAHAVSSLAQAGVEVDLVHAPVPGSSPFSPIGAAEAPGVRSIPLSRNWPFPLDRLPPFSRWHSVRFFGRRLHAEILSRRPDVVYVRHLKLAALLLRQPWMPPVVYEAHEAFADTARESKRARTEALERFVVRSAAAMVCNSRATADRLSERYGAKTRVLVLPNGVSLPATLPDKPWDECWRHVVYAGSFFAWKGTDDLVAAAARLPGFRISLIGGEPQQIERIRPSAAAGASLELFPRMPSSEVAAHLATACLAVLPNRADPDSRFTSPIKLFEYMAAGCAIVSADLPAIREILGSDDAAWFRAGDPQSLADALASLGGDCVRARALGERARALSRDYTWEGRSHRLKTFLEEVVAVQR